MKLALFACSLTVVTPLAAQIPDAPPAYNQLRTPVSPAFVILGVTPTAVERPNTPADLAFSVLNHSAALTSLPRDVALEFSPYWLVSHHKLTWRDDVNRSIGASIARTATISFATAELGTTTRPVTGLSIGLRAAPFSGQLADTTQIVALETALTAASVALQLGLASLQAEKRAAMDSVATREEKAAKAAHYDPMIRAVAESLLNTPPDPNREKAARDSANSVFNDFSVTRRGFVLEVAAGAALQAPNATADSATLLRWGAWLTAGYESPTWSFVFVNRFLANSADSTFDGLDVGMRILWTAKRYALSAEGVFRSFTQSGAPANQYRAAAVIDVEVQQGLWLTGTFGRDYSAAAPGSLIAQFGLSMNVAGQRISVPIRKTP